MLDRIERHQRKTRMESSIAAPEAVVDLLIGLVIAVAAAQITVRLSMKRFRSEQVWEREAEAYSSILESLHHMKRSFAEDLDASISGRDIPESRQEELSKNYRKAYDGLVKRIDLAHSLLSDDAIEVLSTFQKSYGKAKAIRSWTEHLEMGFVAIDDALKSMSAISRAHSKGGLSRNLN